MKHLIILFLLSPLLVEAQPQLITVHFDFDRDSLTADARAALDSIVFTTRTHKIPFKIYGHCDGKGSDAYNDALSIRRVNAVKAYLMQQQVPEALLVTATGFGKRKPLNSNSTDEERTQNRRVEISFELPAEKASETIPVSTATSKKKLSDIIADTATRAGTNLVLKNIHFFGGRHQFLPESFGALKELLEVMLLNKKLVIHIQGHICCIAGPEDGFDFQTQTQNLSSLRAKAIMDYLIQNGVEKERVSYAGLGHSKPLYPFPEKNEEEMKLNRRVEIRIIRK